MSPMQIGCRLRIASIAMFAGLLLTLAFAEGELIAQECQCASPSKCKLDIWIIDTHAVGDCDCDASKARYLRLTDDCKWVRESEEAFLSTLDPEKTLNIMLPGYATAMKYIVEHVWTFHGKLESQAKCRGLDCAPTRLCILAWPSEIDGVPVVHDAREKAIRAETEGYWLAQLIAKMPHGYRVNLVGYSFGGRIATSTAHHLAGGGRCNCPSVAATNSIRLTGTLMAAAVDADWLSQCQPHSLALGRFEKLLLLNNCKDRVLKVYRILSRSRKPDALGAVGLLLPDAKYASHVQQWEVGDLVGKNHNWHRYIEAPEIMWHIAQYAFFLN